MTSWILLLLMLVAFPFLMPEVFISWSRKVRARLRARVRRRMTPEDWERFRQHMPEE